MEREEAAAKAKAAALEVPQADAWLLEDIVVKVIHKELADGRYHKRKGVVKVCCPAPVRWPDACAPSMPPSPPVTSHAPSPLLQQVIDRYAAKVKLIDSKTVLKLDQEFLETVIPAAGGHVLILAGKERGCRARLESLDIDNFCATVNIREGPRRGETARFPYEEISKLAD